MNNKNRFNRTSFETTLMEGLRKEQENIQLSDTPFYPLAFHAEMPENVDFENGHLSFRFMDFSLEHLDKINIKSEAISENEIKIKVNLLEVALKASYEINSKKVHKIKMDTGGSMRALDENYAREAGANDSGVQPLTQTEIDAMVTQARDQKKPIQGTSNGPLLMSAYNKHSESYNTAFVTSPSLREVWAAEGATTQMSRDTHNSLKDGSVVNSPVKIYTNGLTYNSNAATQQTSITMALAIMAIKAGKDGNTALQAKYQAAAKAAASFNETVNETGDSNAEPANMTGKEVYAKLDDKTAKFQEISDAQFRNILDQASSEDPNDGGADEEALKNGWRILRNDERKMIRKSMFLFEQEMLVLKGLKPELLWTGDCNAELAGTEALITLFYDEQKAAWEVSNSEVQLPGFAMELDDSFWTGKTAEIVRERLASIHFVKSLLKNKIQSTIQNLLEGVAKQAIRIA